MRHLNRLYISGIVVLFMISFTQADGSSRDNNDYQKKDANCLYEWENVTLKAKFAPRDGAGAIVYKNKMWLIGGWNPADRLNFPRICNNEVWCSVDGSNWVLKKPNTFIDSNFDINKDWEGRHTSGYVVFEDKMWIIGGDPIQGYYQYDIWNSSDGKNWNYVNKDVKVPWGPRVLHYTVVFNGKIWVMGGQTLPQFAPEKEIFYRDIWNSEDGVHWTKLNPKEPYWSARGMIGGSVVFKDRIWIIGGGTYDTPQTPKRNYYNDVWSSSDGINWFCHLKNAPWHSRQYHEIAVYDNKIWVLEGYHQNSGNRNDVWYSSDGVDWHTLSGTPWNARHAASVFVYDDALWIVAGNNMQSDVWKLKRKTIDRNSTWK